MASLKYNLSFEDLYSLPGLRALDLHFLAFLRETDAPLADQIEAARAHPERLTKLEESALLLQLSPFLEDFLGHFFGIETDLFRLQESHQSLAPLYTCKRLFVQRQAVKTYLPEACQAWNETDLQTELEAFLEAPFSELTFAKCVLEWMAHEASFSSQLDVAKRYAAWRCYLRPEGGVLFHLPQKRDVEALIPVRPRLHQGFDVLEKDQNHLTQREGFSLTTRLISREKALDQSHYCILCHRQGKDSCSTGLKEKQNASLFQKNPHGVDLIGCPLEQKISEMNTLRGQGYALGALAVIMIDNPLVAATGNRICNDCTKACIYQKQDPVDIPAVETQTLQEILALPWGFEIYSLLSRWNPLNIHSPLPQPSSGYKVLVAGLGPAGFTLAHYLMNAGHDVVGIDGLKLEPLPPSWSGVTVLGERVPFLPIKQVQDLFVPLDRRPSQGFGGVAEYGITARWDKNFLTLVRLLLERREACLLMGSVRLGSTLTVDQAFERGFDHVALCLGAGRPQIPPLKSVLARGVRTASDFLMALQLTGAGRENTLANLQIRLPIAVIGGGLTAVDTATEALAYYPVQVEAFLKNYEKVLQEEPDAFQSLWDAEEAEITQEFLTHGRLLREEKALALQEGRSPRITELLQKWGGATIFYRRTLQDSPSYRLSPEEVSLALAQGIFWKDSQTPQEVLSDTYGHARGLTFQEGSDIFPCKTILIATGTAPNTILATEDPSFPLQGDTFQAADLSGNPVSPENLAKPSQVHVQVYRTSQHPQAVTFFGDLHPSYKGNVVKAMASAKYGAPVINQLLKQHPSSAKSFEMLKNQMNEDLRSVVQDVIPLTSTIWEITLKSPQAARQFQPGQFFRFQNLESLASLKNDKILAMEGLALTGAEACPETGLLSLIVLDMGASSHLCGFLKKGEPVSLMGPTGTPTTIPAGETVLLVGGGLGNAVLFSIAKAMKEKGNRVLYIAGYRGPQDVFKRDKLEEACDQILWCCESGNITPSRPQDLFFSGNVVEGLHFYASLKDPFILFQEVDRLIVIGSDQMMAAVAAARKGILNPAHIAIGSINSPMQCMMKEICGQCLQIQEDPKTGETRLVYSCHTQDQPLDQVDFSCLHQRLRQNSVLEKMAKIQVKNIG